MHKDSPAEMEKAYEAQLRRKDSEIEELRKRNDVLVKTALRQNEKLVQIEEMIKKIQDICLTGRDTKRR